MRATALIVAYAFLVQGYAVWKLRRALTVGRLIPFIAEVMETLTRFVE